MFKEIRGQIINFDNVTCVRRYTDSNNHLIKIYHIWGGSSTLWFENKSDREEYFEYLEDLLIEQDWQTVMNNEDYDLSKDIETTSTASVPKV